MLGSEVIEVGIGMALLFLFMSLIATALRELIENLLKSRSRDLERGVREMLQHTGNAQRVREFYEHPLISSLYKGNYVEGGRDLPSYIPRQSFSMAVLDMLTAANGVAPAMSVDSLEATLTGVTNPDALQRVALLAIQTADGDLQKVRTSIEDWYDGTMDRVSGWYTRRTGRILGVIGFLAALFFNVDAIVVAERLVQDKPLRQAVVEQAKALATKPTESDQPSDGGGAVARRVVSLQTAFDDIGFPIGWTRATRGGWPTPPQVCRGDAGTQALASTQVAALPPDCTVDPWLWARAVFGWAITALAIMLGAPFWFDVLNRFMIIRSTIKPKEKSPDEASTDPQAPAASVTSADGSPGRLGRSPGPALPEAVQQVAANVAAMLAVSEGAFEPRQWADNSDHQAGVM